MSQRVSDQPGLFEPGEHRWCVEQLKILCVGYFPLSKTRVSIFAGFMRLYRQLIDSKIDGDLVVDGSFLTQEIDPDDVDLTLTVSPDFYESCQPDQRKILEWVRDDFSIKTTHLCDCYLCVEYPKEHPEYFDGIQNRQYWVNFYSKSVTFKRDRGVVIVELEDGEIV